MGASIESVLRDIRYAFRSLRRSPGFTVVAVLMLALGIGANTAIFTLINTIMLSVLPVAHPEELFLLTDPGASGVDTDSTENGVRTLFAYPEFQELRARNNVFSGMFAAQSAPNTGEVFVGPGKQSRRARVQLVSGEFFGVLGIHPAAGRVFTSAETQVEGASPVAVISWQFWQRQFAGSADAIGKTLRIGNGRFHIVGIAPEGFRGIEIGAQSDVWVPLSMQKQALPGRDYLTPRDTLWLQVMGRTKPGLSRQSVQASIDVTLRQFLQAWGVKENDLHQSIELSPGAKGASEVRDEFSGALLILMAMVVLVLLIACANIANLMLARGAARQKEIGVRLALGAARFRLVRQIMTESVLIAAAGGALGMILASLGTRLLLAFAAATLDLSLDIRADGKVLLFTATVSLLTGALFGLIPALRETRTGPGHTLSMNQRGAVGTRLRGGRFLVVAQIALSLILISGATLLAGSLRNMLIEKVGFDRSHLLMAFVDPLTAGYRGDGLIPLYGKVLSELHSIRGIRNVSVANQGLFGGGDSQDPISLDGSAIRNRAELRSLWTLVGADYFSTLGVPLLRGREIGAADTGRASQVCVVNESFARKFYPDSDPIGRHVTDEYPTTRETCEIVGVVADAKEHRPNEPSRPRFYANLFHPIGSVHGAVFLIATAGDPATAGNTVRAAIARAVPGLPITALRTVEVQLGLRLVKERLIANLSGLFGGLGLFMAAIGLYGVISYAMSRRTGEIGIRMALGASRGNVMRLVLMETGWLVLFGAATGIPCAIAASRLLAGMLFGLKPGDPSALAIALGVVLVVAAMAAILPARRAARVDPMNALRCE